MLSEQHLVGADHLLPPQRTPTEVVVPTSSQMVGDLTPLQGPGPDIAADAKAAALVRVLLPFCTQIGPPPISSEFFRKRRQVGGVNLNAHPVVVLKAWIVVIDARRTNTPNFICYELLCVIITCFYVLLPWIAPPMRRAVSFRRACVISVPSAKLSLVYVGSGSFHVNLVLLGTSVIIGWDFCNNV